MKGQLIVLILVPFSEIQGPDGFTSPEMGYPQVIQPLEVTRNPIR